MDIKLKNTVKVTVQAGIEKKTFDIPLSEYYTLIRKLEIMDKKNIQNLTLRNPFNTD